jgi:hypothetical protein
MAESDYERQQEQAAGQADYEREQEEQAAADAAAIGGRVSSAPPGSGEQDDEIDPAEVPLREAGQGEAEGFEDAERELIEHASHGDEHAARRVLEDAPDPEGARAGRYGEADSEGAPQ